MTKQTILPVRHIKRTEFDKAKTECEIIATNEIGFITPIGQYFRFYLNIANKYYTGVLLTEFDPQRFVHSFTVHDVLEATYMTIDKLWDEPAESQEAA